MAPRCHPRFGCNWLTLQLIRPFPPRASAANKSQIHGQRDIRQEQHHVRGDGDRPDPRRDRTVGVDDQVVGEGAHAG